MVKLKVPQVSLELDIAEKYLKKKTKTKNLGKDENRNPCSHLQVASMSHKGNSLLGGYWCDSKSVALDNTLMAAPCVFTLWVSTELFIPQRNSLFEQAALYIISSGEHEKLFKVGKWKVKVT